MRKIKYEMFNTHNSIFQALAETKIFASSVDVVSITGIGGYIVVWYKPERIEK